MGDACDNCPNKPNPDQADSDFGIPVLPIAATATSESPGYPASNVLKEDCPVDAGESPLCSASRGNDCHTAWLPGALTGNALTVQFTPAHAKGLTWLEGCVAGGFVTSIDLVDDNGTVHADWWTGPDLADWRQSTDHYGHNGPTRFTVDFHEITSFRVASVVMHIKDNVPAQIDAVYLLAADTAGDACDAAPSDPYKP